MSEPGTAEPTGPAEPRGPQEPRGWRLWPWLLLLLVAPLVLQRLIVPPPVPLPVEVLPLEAALEQAEAATRPVLVSVYATWCSACRMLDAKVLVDPAVEAAIRAGFVFARVDIDTEIGRGFTREHDIQAVPTLLVLDPDGTLSERLPTTLDPQHLAAELRRVSAQSALERSTGLDT